MEYLQLFSVYQGRLVSAGSNSQEKALVRDGMPEDLEFKANLGCLPR